MPRPHASTPAPRARGCDSRLSRDARRARDGSPCCRPSAQARTALCPSVRPRFFGIGQTICHDLRVTSLAAALVLGLALFPVVLVFGPVYFPWSLLVLATVGALVGLLIAPERVHTRLLHALGLAALMVAVVLGVFGATSNL